MSRAIVHLDVDCFYAQVECAARRIHPDTPLAVRQKGLLVTCNYAARSRGLRKCMPAAEGLRLCPELVVVCGEDLRPYRRASERVADALRSFGSPVERLGLDEAFVDVTEATALRLREGEIPEAVGRAICARPELCDCPEGTHDRLAVASTLAGDMRRKIADDVGLACCAGVSHNKLLAKLAGGVHRPNQQTIAYPCARVDFLSSLGSVRTLPGVGAKTATALAALGVDTVLALQRCDRAPLEDALGRDVASKLKRMSLGVDDDPVRPSGRPLTVGAEDSFESIAVVDEVRAKFETLLDRLLTLLRDDGRVPGGIKVTLRQVSGSRTTPHRETRQCHLPRSFFARDNGAVRLADGARERLLGVVMRLFHKSVDLSKPFRLTLLGLAFAKFQEADARVGSIVDYLIKDVSVQSMIDLHNDSAGGEASRPGRSALPFPPGAEDEVEPSPKKVKRSSRPSPDGLRVADLNLNATDRASASADSPRVSRTEDNPFRVRERLPEELDDLELPPDVDGEVFSALPVEVRDELRLSWKRDKSQSSACRRTSQKEPRNSIARYFIQNK